MQRLRSILFYVFVALYLVVTPVAILYALGYQIHPGDGRGLVKTGLITLESEPSGARVFMGASRYRWKTPTMIRELKPGVYPVRLILRGHQEWSAEVRVEPEKATVLDHLLLLPNPVQSSLLSTQSFGALLPVPAGKAFLLRSGKLGSGLFVVEAGRDDVTPLLPTNDAFAALEIQSVHSVPENPCLLLEAQSADGLVYGWRRLDQNERATRDISSLFPQPVRAVGWDGKARSELFTLSGSELNRLDLDDRAFYPAVREEVLTFSVFQGDLYILDASNQFYRTSRDGERKPVQVGQSPAEVNMARASKEGYAVHPLDEDSSLFIGREGECFLNREPYDLLDAGLKGWATATEDKLIALWDRNRIGVYDYSRRAGEIPAGVEWVHLSSHAIEQVFWCYENSHLLVAGDGQLELIPLARGGGGPARLLTAYEPGSALCYSERAGAVYYLEAVSRRLAKLQILPKRNLLNLGWSKAEPSAEVSKP